VVVVAFVEEVCDGEVLEALHAEGLSAACLSVGEDGDYALVEDAIDDRFDLICVELIR